MPDLAQSSPLMARLAPTDPSAKCEPAWWTANREHLEFSIWYLKENGLITRMDNGRLAVTAKGVDWAEQEEAAERMRTDRLLEAANSSPNVH